MKIDVMRQPLMASLLLFAALAVLFCYRFSTFPYPEELFVNNSTPVAELLYGFSVRYRTIATVLAMLLVFFNGISISRILSQHMVVPSRCYLPIVFYLLISCGIWFGAACLPAVLASFGALRSIEYFISSFVRKASFDTTFRGAVLLGCAPILYPPSLIYFLIIPVAMALFRRHGRESVVALIGGILPLLAYAYVMWAMNHGFIEPMQNIWNGAFENSGRIHLDTLSTLEIMRLVPLLLSGLLALAGLVSFVSISNTMRTRGRTIFIFFILLLLIGIGQLITPAAAPPVATMLAIPAAAVIPMFFSRFPGLASGIVYTILVISVVMLNLYPLLLT